MKKLAVHKDWVIGCKITESFDEKKEGYSQSAVSYRRFTATILGWRGWIIFEDYLYEGVGEDVKSAVEIIKKEIEKGNEKIFETKGTYVLYQVLRNRVMSMKERVKSE